MTKGDRYHFLIETEINGAIYTEGFLAEGTEQAVKYAKERLKTLPDAKKVKLSCMNADFVPVHIDSETRKENHRNRNRK